MFQTGWFLCVLTAKPISSIYTALFIATHFWILLRDKTSKGNQTFFKKELLWIIAVAGGGWILETISFSAAFLYTANPLSLGPLSLPPLWLLNLWIQFAIGLRTFLSPIFNRMKLTYLLACIAIPLNYYSGAALNTDVAVNDPYIINLAMISILWIGLLWLLDQMKRRYFEDILDAR